MSKFCVQIESKKKIWSVAKIDTFKNINSVLVTLDGEFKLFDTKQEAEAFAAECSQVAGNKNYQVAEVN